MTVLLARSRMRVQQRWLVARPAARMVPGDWLVIGFAVLVCVSLRMTSTDLLVASAWREGGRVLSCHYFTGTRMVERQHLRAKHEADLPACPLVRMG